MAAGRRISSASSISISVGAAKAEPSRDLRLDRRDDVRVGVAEDERRVVAEEIAVLVAVDVPCPHAPRPEPCTADTAG